MRCLFLPDNLMSIMYEEQKILQSELSEPFRKTIPFFRTDKNFKTIKIYPPIFINGNIIRPCNFEENQTQNIEGFILGQTDYFANEAFFKLKIEQLKKKSRFKIFSILTSRSWYFADFECHAEKEVYSWKISNIKWQKQK